MLSKKKMEHFSKLLNKRLEELLNEVNRTVSGMTTDKENLPDPSDRATLESDRNFTLRIRDRERKLIGKIKEAIERIENKTYGVCEECGDDIRHWPPREEYELEKEIHKDKEYRHSKKSMGDDVVDSVRSGGFLLDGWFGRRHFADTPAKIPALLLEDVGFEILAVF